MEKQCVLNLGYRTLGEETCFKLRGNKIEIRIWDKLPVLNLRLRVFNLSKREISTEYEEKGILFNFILRIFNFLTFKNKEEVRYF